MLRLGLIGTGYGLEVQAEAFKYNHIFKLESVCSKDASEAKKAKKTVGFKTWYNDWNQLISSDKLDVVCISTPNHLHYKMAKTALEQDKHVICSAPFTLTVAEAEELTALANQKNKVCVVDHHMNLMPARKYLMRLLKDGKVGAIHTVERTLHNGTTYQNNVAYNWKQSADCGGGLFFNTASHDIDFLLRAVGGIHKVSLNMHTAFNKIIDEDGNAHVASADDSYQMQIRFHKGVKGIISASSTSPMRDVNEFIFHGSEGSLLLNKDNEIIFFDKDGKRERIAIPPNFQITSLPGHKQRSPFYMFTETVATAIYNDTSVTPTFDEAVHIQRVLQAGLDSNKYHQWIEVGTEISKPSETTPSSQSVDKIFEWGLGLGKPPGYAYNSFFTFGSRYSHEKNLAIVFKSNPNCDQLTEILPESEIEH